MAYTINPQVPKVRWQAVKMLKAGRSTREVARYFGYNQSSIVRWAQKAKIRNVGAIPTLSSRPHVSPLALSEELVQAIISKRLERNRCGQVVHQALLQEGIPVSLSSVQRTIDRCGLTKKRSPWKRPHDYTQRPEAAFPGAFVEIDTIHLMNPLGGRIYVYTLIDVHSRWAYAEVVEKIGVEPSIRFFQKVLKKVPFPLLMVQSDNGSEFSIGFTHTLKRSGVGHRHSRVRRSNDQAHVERFNRTVQEECLDHVSHGLKTFRKALKEYLPYYNEERTHMGINYQTPSQVMQRY
jgi:transposase InsO family protein